MAEIDAGFCPICEAALDKRDAPGGDAERICCPRCGSYSISGTALAIWNGGKPYAPRLLANASGWLRENPGTAIYQDTLQQILEIQSPRVGERAEKLMLALERESASIGAVLQLEFRPEDARWLAISWSSNWEELSFLLQRYLRDRTYWIEEVALWNGGMAFKITPSGYEFLEAQRHSSGDGSQGFCAMWFGDEVTELWSKAIEPAIADAGYRPVRIDKVEHNNRIDDEILAQIRRSRFVVADFTGQRGGVYFEAGFALGLGLQVIWTVREDTLKDIHFDNRQYNFLKWSPGDFPALRKALHYRIEATMGRGPLV